MKIENVFALTLVVLFPQDSEALMRAQQAILQLQAEVEKLHSTTADIIDENKHRTQQIEVRFLDIQRIMLCLVFLCPRIK